MQLNENIIRLYQPVLNDPSEFGEEWKAEVIVALSKRPVEILILEGNNALEKANILKKRIRTEYCDQKNYQGRIIFNLIHTASDVLELENNIRVLIPEALKLLYTEAFI